MKKILLVEDDRTYRQALRFELEDEGYQVTSVPGFSGALRAIRHSQFDLVISDIFLHQSNGLKLYQIIQKLRKNIPFIGMTAFPGLNLSLEAESILEDCFFVKPFSFQDLKTKINSVLAKV
jgi:DNA-binding NtrC family response regulator